MAVKKQVTKVRAASVWRSRTLVMVPWEQGNVRISNYEDLWRTSALLLEGSDGGRRQLESLDFRTLCVAWYSERSTAFGELNASIVGTTWVLPTQFLLLEADNLSDWTSSKSTESIEATAIMFYQRRIYGLTIKWTIKTGHVSQWPKTDRQGKRNKPI